MFNIINTYMEQDENMFNTHNNSHPCLAVYNPHSSPAPVKRSNYIIIIQHT